MIARLILKFVPLCCVHGMVLSPESGDAVVTSWLQEEDRSLAISNSRKLQLLIEYEWACEFEMTDLVCSYTKSLEDIATGETSEVSATLHCPDAPDTAIRSATNCICDAQVRPQQGSFETHHCDCFICSDERSFDVLTVNCETATASNTIVGECKNLDCNNICNGFCTDACPPESLEDPLCVTCPRSTESPTESTGSVPTSPPTAVFKKEKKIVKKSAKTEAKAKAKKPAKKGQKYN